LAVTDYRDVPAVEEALFILMKAYDALDMTQLRDDSKRVLERSYPQSRFLAQNTSLSTHPWWKFW
jgi:outer membrane protein assembly factor BamD